MLQLSINAQESFDYHFQLGAKLARLRTRGILVVGSGNVVHNLRRVDRAQPDTAFDWNRRFDDAAKSLMISSPADIGWLRDHADYSLAVPTPDHFIALLYIAGLAAADGKRSQVLIDGYAMGSLSMTSYGVDMAHSLSFGADTGAPPLDGGLPADQTNL